MASNDADGIGAGGFEHLTDRQRRLVEENLGLVGVHIRRCVRNTAVGKTDRDYDDLFQEGCIGLIQSARKFDPDGEIPFAAFALPRIHTAVSAALLRDESLIRVPRKRKRVAQPGDAENGGTDATPQREIPRVYSLDIDPRLGGVVGPNETSETYTIGERLREKYEQAVEVATRIVTRRKATRADRGELIERIIQQRLLVPEEDAKSALRQIARDTNSSYSRVLQCERRIQSAMRRALTGDLEFRQLQESARRSEVGPDQEIDPDLESRLKESAAESCWRRLTALKRPARKRFIRSMGSGADKHTRESFRKMFIALPRSESDELLKQVSSE
jgi:RNA polymerase sigma factor (sigma-70 family)